jgi:hypothetical protein
VKKCIFHPREKPANLKVGVSKNLLSALSVSSVRTLFFKTGTKAYRAVARKRGAYAAMATQAKNRAIDSGLVS